jgi:hypothetical protein
MVRLIRQGATGSCAIDSTAFAYYSFEDSLLHYSLRSQDTSLFTASTAGPVRRIQFDESNIYIIADNSCRASLVKIARTNTSTLVLDDSISCNAEFVVDSAFVYVSDDMSGGRIRAICNPTVTQDRSAIIPARLDFGTISIQSNSKLLPIENTSSVDYTVYPNVNHGQFSLYPPYLSIPAHSTMSFRVYCLDTTSPLVEDVVDFSINGDAPYASTKLLASRVMSVTPQAPTSPKLAFVDGSVVVSGIIGNFDLTSYDMLGRMTEKWHGVSTGAPESFKISEKHQFNIIRMQQGGHPTYLKIFH